MGHPQPPTVIRTDNCTACGVLTGSMKQKRSKAINMRYNFIKDRAVNHKQLSIRWSPRKYNLADYVTKHHPSSHHKRVRPIYLYIKGKSPTTIKGRAKIFIPDKEANLVRILPNGMTQNKHNVQQNSIVQELNLYSNS